MACMKVVKHWRWAFDYSAPDTSLMGLKWLKVKRETSVINISARTWSPDSYVWMHTCPCWISCESKVETPAGLCSTHAFVRRNDRESPCVHVKMWMGLSRAVQKVEAKRPKQIQKPHWTRPDIRSQRPRTSLPPSTAHRWVTGTSVGGVTHSVEGWFRLTLVHTYIVDGQQGVASVGRGNCPKLVLILKNSLVQYYFVPFFIAQRSKKDVSEICIITRPQPKKTLSRFLCLFLKPNLSRTQLPLLENKWHFGNYFLSRLRKHRNESKTFRNWFDK